MALRFELKKEFQPPVADSEYQDLKGMLNRAQEKSEKHHVYWDLNKGQSKAEVKKKLTYVSEKEGINLRIQSLRKENSLRLTFPGTPKKTTTAKRMSAEQARHLIIEALIKATQPLSRADILEETDINASSWNVRIKELMDEGVVKKVGSRRNTRYELK